MSVPSKDLGGGGIDEYSIVTLCTVCALMFIIIIIIALLLYNIYMPMSIVFYLLNANLYHYFSYYIYHCLYLYITVIFTSM